MHVQGMYAPPHLQQRTGHSSSWSSNHILLLTGQGGVARLQELEVVL